MPRYTCPKCDGGFDEPKSYRHESNGLQYDGCAWCGTPLGGYDADLAKVIE